MTCRFDDDSTRDGSGSPRDSLEADLEDRAVARLSDEEVQAILDWHQHDEQAEAALVLAAPDLAAEVLALRTERDRFARILAVEQGDESAAPEEWGRCVGGWQWVREVDGVQWYVRRTGTHEWSWGMWVVPLRHLGAAPTALEAIEAADAAREAGDE